MSVRFTFASGKEQEFNYEWIKLAPKLQLAGMRMFKPEPGVLIPLNSNTIALIEDIRDDNEEEETPQIEESRVKYVAPKEVVEEKEEEDEKPLSIEEKKEKILNEMKEKSECQHENKEIYYQEMLSGRAPNQKMQKRYFPVCSFCGVRERYVKAESLTDDEKLNAKLWDK